MRASQMTPLETTRAAKDSFSSTSFPSVCLVPSQAPYTYGVLDIFKMEVSWLGGQGPRSSSILGFPVKTFFGLIQRVAQG